MVTVRFYNKNSNRLDFRYKLFFLSSCPDYLVYDFAQEISYRSGKSNAQYIAYAKDGRVIAREASYRGV